MPFAMASISLSCESLTSGVGMCGIAIEVDHKERWKGSLKEKPLEDVKPRKGKKIDPNFALNGLFIIAGDDSSKAHDPQVQLKINKLERKSKPESALDLLYRFEDGDLTRHKLCHKLKDKNQGTLLECILALCVWIETRDDEIKELKFNASMSSDALPCNSCSSLLAKNDDLNASLACLKSENDTLKSNASMPCNSCVALHSDLDKARDEVVLLKSNASLPCASCESLIAEIKELKLTHTTCVEQLEHARAEINEIKSLPSAMCSLKENGDALYGISKIDASPIICTTCIDLKSEVEALKRVRDDMSARLVEHKDMSARFEIEVDLLRTTFSKCI